MFRDAMGGRGRIRNYTIADLWMDEGETSDISVEGIFAKLRGEPLVAARNLLAYLQKPSAGPKAAEEIMDAARMLVFLKGTNPHDYKFSSAIFEDCYHVSPEWRNQYLAANAFMLLSSADRDNQLVERTRGAFGVR
jgi:hypothetical protein